jgi:hypothetical protein
MSAMLRLNFRPATLSAVVERIRNGLLTIATFGVERATLAASRAVCREQDNGRDPGAFRGSDHPFS